MENNNAYQLELFSKAGSTDKLTARMHNNNLLAFMRNYEKTLLLAIAFIIIGIAAFSLGVKRGKTNQGQTPPAASNAIVNKKEQVAYPANAAPLIKMPNAATTNQTQPPKTKEYIEKYTIQLATYKAKTSAQKEADGLKKTGFSPILLSNDKYSVLCIGNFPNKETARNLLVKLKKQYRDCFIRRL